jgi:hypothetical protein
MNTKKAFLIAVVAVVVLAFIRLRAVESKPAPAACEYATIRWGGRDNTHIIRPGGQVEFIGAELKKLSRPERSDDRAFFMNVAMNGLVKEFAGMNTDEIVMKRAVIR